MSLERPDVAYYDSGTNVQFADALVENIVLPAVFNARHKDTSEGLDGDILNDCEVWHEGNRTQYEFYSRPNAEMVVITSTEHFNVNDLSEPGSQMLFEEIRASNILEDVKKRYQDDASLLQEQAVVETFTRRTFYIRLLEDDSSDVQVKVDLGCCIDGQDIEQEDSQNKLDQERETVFEVGEIVEIVRALLALDLIKQSDVKRFLDQKF